MRVEVKAVDTQQSHHTVVFDPSGLRASLLVIRGVITSSFFLGVEARELTPIISEVT